VLRAARPWKTAFLAAVFAWMAVEGSHAGGKASGPACAGNPGWSRSDRLDLSLRIARARKDDRAIARYKSLLRQHRRKAPRSPGRAPAPPCEDRSATCRFPPWVR
jgi:hypothetical protein